ncbi:excisionase transposon Tn916 [Firmicutes bacterium CAG:170]|nr:excisionase transposon Tn916 [Firmicutes bacterium CAG:170]
MELYDRIPLWEQYTLSIDEAAQYFRIGRNTLRKIVAGNPNADYLLWIGRKAQIKRTLFEKYIDQHNVV